MCNAVERIVGEKKEEKGKKRHKLTFVRFKNVNFQSIYVPVRDLPGLCQLQRHHNVIQSLLGHLVTWIPNCNPYKKYSMQWFHFWSGHFLMDITWNFEDLEKNRKKRKQKGTIHLGRWEIFPILYPFFLPWQQSHYREVPRWGVS